MNEVARVRGQISRSATHFRVGRAISPSPPTDQEGRPSNLAPFLSSSLNERQPNSPYVCR